MLKGRHTDLFLTSSFKKMDYYLLNLDTAFKEKIWNVQYWLDHQWNHETIKTGN